MSSSSLQSLSGFVLSVWGGCWLTVTWKTSTRYILRCWGSTLITGSQGWKTNHDPTRSTSHSHTGCAFRWFLSSPQRNFQDALYTMDVTITAFEIETMGIRFCIFVFLVHICVPKTTAYYLCRSWDSTRSALKNIFFFRQRYFRFVSIKKKPFKKYTNNKTT